MAKKLPPVANPTSTLKRPTKALTPEEIAKKMGAKIVKPGSAPTPQPTPAELEKIRDIMKNMSPAGIQARLNVQG